MEQCKYWNSKWVSKVLLWPIVSANISFLNGFAEPRIIVLSLKIRIYVTKLVRILVLFQTSIYIHKSNFDQCFNLKNCNFVSSQNRLLKCWKTLRIIFWWLNTIPAHCVIRFPSLSQENKKRKMFSLYLFRDRCNFHQQTQLHVRNQV